VYVINADGSHQERLTTTAFIEDGHPKAYNKNPAWSPDGRQIAFASARSGNLEIHVMNADGSEPRQLTQSDGSKDLPNWSPDGTQIAFMEGGGISVMDSTGNNLRKLTTHGFLDFYPSWSPDGKYLAYRSQVEVDMKVRPPKMGRSEIFATRIEDGQSVRLTTTSINNTYPCWIH
jgi:TolB protein